MTDDKGEVDLKISYNTKPSQSGWIYYMTGHIIDYIIIIFYDIIYIIVAAK